MERLVKAKELRGSFAVLNFPAPDLYLSCCGSNTTASIGETIYCHDCDVYANVVEGDIEFQDADGEPVTQYVLPNGMLSDEPVRDSLEERAEFELYDETGLCVAAVSGPRSEARRDINHYALIYGQDGPVTIREKKRRQKVDKSIRGVMNTATVEDVIGFTAACLGILCMKHALGTMAIPAINNRETAIRQYAERYVNHAYEHETLEAYAEQAALDLKDKSAEVDVKRAIRRLRRAKEALWA